MRKVRCRNCGAVSELPDHHGAKMTVCPECEWHETHPPRRPIPETMEGEASAAYQAHAARLRKAEARLDLVRKLSPRAFERFCGELFEQEGFEALPAANKAYRLELRRGEEVVYVACVLGTPERVIEPAELEDLAAALRHESVDRGIFVTTGSFTGSCEKAATEADIELVDGSDLREKIAFADADRIDRWLADRAG